MDTSQLVIHVKKIKTLMYASFRGICLTAVRTQPSNDTAATTARVSSHATVCHVSLNALFAMF